MAFSFSSIGHALAAGLHDVWTGMKAVESFVAKADTPANQQVIEGLTSLIPVIGPQAATVERGVFAIAGQAAAILTNITNSGEQKLLDAGFDAMVIADFKALIAAVPSMVSTAKAAPVTPK